MVLQMHTLGGKEIDPAAQIQRLVHKRFTVHCRREGQLTIV